ncbi:MAG: hypothetical protein FD189_1272 [Elusimicrobia bacterium]|nr:MAG: hypothetical protein FD154_132 [Elusimicrobiota bacterium]KAF0155794.1 MAG: hypothetical protein FD189_1272 [Elusimicrobiota bacterium]
MPETELLKGRREWPARLTLAVFLAAAGWTALLHSRSPFASAVSSGRPFAFALADAEAPGVAVYRPSSRTLELFHLPRRAAGNRRSDASAAAASIEVFYGEAGGEPALSGFYADLSPARLEALLRGLASWRTSPRALASAARDAKPRTNFGPYCAAALAFEALSLAPSRLVISQAGALLKDQPSWTGEAGGVTAQVLNASGRRGAADAVTRRLRSRGIDVIDYGNYVSVQPRTKIVNCSGGVEGARRVRELLGLGGLEIYSKPEKNPVAGVRVIIGLDFDPATLK